MNKKAVLSYSVIEQKKNGIAGIGKRLFIFLSIFPAIPLFLAFFSCFIIKISDKTFEAAFVLLALLLAIYCLMGIAVWLKDIVTVYIVSDDGHLYKLHVSGFWYKLKNKTYMLNPSGTSQGRVFRLFYMISNIKYIINEISDEISFDDLITMGRIIKYDNISNVKIDDKKITFTADIISKKSHNNTKIKISRVYDKDKMLCEYLSKYSQEGIEAANNVDFNAKYNPTLEMINKNIKGKKTSYKLYTFTVKWTVIMLWIAVITISSDLKKLSLINAGEYVKSSVYINKGNIVSDEDDITNADYEKVYRSVDNPSEFFKASSYGKSYKPVGVIYVSVEIIYLILILSEMIFPSEKKAKEKD